MVLGRIGRLHLDCYLINNGKPAANEGDIIAKRLGWNIEEAGYKHSHIRYKDLLIENHHFLTNFNQTKQGIRIERILRQLALEGRERQMGETNLWKPSPEFQVIFYLMHSLGDFIAQDMSLKAIYDWAVFLKKEQTVIDWDRMTVLLEQCRLKCFFDLMTEVCIIYLGLEIGRNTFTIRSDRKMADDMLVDIEADNEQWTTWYSAENPQYSKTFQAANSLSDNQYRTTFHLNLEYNSV